MKLSYSMQTKWTSLLTEALIFINKTKRDQSKYSPTWDSESKLLYSTLECCTAGEINKAIGIDMYIVPLKVAKRIDLKSSHYKKKNC